MGEVTNEEQEEQYLEESLEEMISSKRAKGRGKETLFRVTIRNQINQISIADNKANMIISINTIIISLIVAVLGSGLNFSGWPFLGWSHISVPLMILMTFCFASASYSILAARPKIIKGTNPDPRKISLLFFGTFQDFSLEQYLEKMEGLLMSNSDIYRTMIIDMYYNGQILLKKYKLLRTSYTLFFIGLSLCVGVYFILLAFKEELPN